MTDNVINVTFGAAGATDFNASNFVFQTLVDANFKFELSADTIRFYSGKSDFVELQGSFNADSDSTNYADFVNSITGYRVVDHGKLAYKIEGLEMTGEDIASPQALRHYLRHNEYAVDGNNAANDLYSSGKADRLNGLDGNDFLSSGAGDDALLGGKGNDTFEAGEGNDSINDKIGADTLIFHRGDGMDTVSGFNLLGKGHDTIDLSEFYSGDKELNFKSLDISRHGKSDVEIDLGGDDHILLKDVNIKHVDAGDFQF
jgi:Ca2+-binding RTX toxin-like protein